MRIDLIEIDHAFQDSIRREFPYGKPLVREIQAFLPSLGFSTADALALGSLLVAVWAYVFPRNAGPRCPHKHHFSGHICKQPIVNIHYDPRAQELLLHCVVGHTTRQRTSRIYR